MGAKAKAKRQASNNVVKFNNYLPKKNKSIDIIPRNRNQENYVLSLMNDEKSIVFGIGPAGTGKTLLACQAAVKSFLQNDVDKIIVIDKGKIVEMGSHEELLKKNNIYSNLSKMQNLS